MDYLCFCQSCKEMTTRFIYFHVTGDMQLVFARNMGASAMVIALKDSGKLTAVPLQYQIPKLKKGK